MSPGGKATDQESPDAAALPDDRTDQPESRKPMTAAEMPHQETAND